MEKMVQPENIMGISLLHKCNFNCEHCGYIYVGDEMKTYYGKAGITFGDFPMLAIGKAKNLEDQMPNPPEFTPPVYKEATERVGAVLVGEDYYHGDKRVAKLGHLKEYYDNMKKKIKEN